MFSVSLALLLFSTAPRAAAAASAPVAQQTKDPIRVYPTPEAQGSITVLSAAKCTVLFYLFDAEGKLVYQSRLSKHEAQIIEGLTNGTYTYHAFQNDEKLKGGKVDIKH